VEKGTVGRAGRGQEDYTFRERGLISPQNTEEEGIDKAGELKKGSGGLS